MFTKTPEVFNLARGEYQMEAPKNDSLLEDQIKEELFQELKGVMEKEVAEMPLVATRREFLQKIAVCTAVVPAGIVAMALGPQTLAGCSFCDEYNGQRITCWFCDERSGVKTCTISVDCGDCNSSCKSGPNPIMRGGCGASLL